MEDDFIEDDFLEEDESSASNNRPFLVAVGALVTVFILAAICTLAILMANNRNAGNAAEVAAIETQNAETLSLNATVTRQIAETEAAQAVPSDTPEPPPTNTSTPVPATEEPEATNTPVLDSVIGEAGENGDGEGMEGEGADGEDGRESATGEEVVGGAEGTIIIGGESGNGSDGAESGSAIIGGSATPISATDAQKGALPQTGLEIWIVALIGLLLVAVLFAANRLRTE